MSNRRAHAHSPDNMPAEHERGAILPRAKKSLGQHFLKSQKALNQIVTAAHISPGETVLEIGPGQGALTERLLAAGANVIAIEKDTDLIPLLTEKFSAEMAGTAPRATGGYFALQESDVLRFDPETIPGPYKLVANIPYYITGAIIEQFLSTAHQPSAMVLLVQKEVAERMVAKDGKGSILSIATKAYGTPHIVGIVPPGAFAPAPNVDSAVIAIDGISREFFAGSSSSTDATAETIEPCDEAFFLTLIKTLFGQKRRQLGGTLAAFIGNRERAMAILHNAGIDSKTRAEELSLAQWRTIAIETRKAVQ